MSLLLSLPIGLLICLGILFLGLLLGVFFEAPKTSTVLVMITVGVLWFFFDIPIFSAIWNNPLWAILGFIAYFVVGTGWSMVKWFLHALRLKDDYIEAMTLWINHYATDKSAEEANLAWWTSMSGEDWHTKIPPQASNNKELITLWILYWPWSMLWTLLDDPLRRLVNWIYRQIQFVYVRITDKVFAGINVPTQRELQLETQRLRAKQQEAWNKQESEKARVNAYGYDEEADE